MNVKSEVISTDGSNLGPIRVVMCSLILGAHEFKHNFIVCKDLFCTVILGLDFSQDFRVEINWSKQGQLYLHQDHKPLTYSKTIFKGLHNHFVIMEGGQIDLQNKHTPTPFKTIAVVITKSTNSSSTSTTKDEDCKCPSKSFLM